ncbi:sensor histidine kinase [Hyalangium versicolor]|uniref:sensor histidine kinase n=1 Tax=Hyalangium versicolor TaxID=2861190 RepID=UPI001CC91B83|nr:ATP-binding protein [Hyalangium versicolor]
MRRLTYPSSKHSLSRDDALALVEVVQELAYLRELGDVMTLVRRAARELTGADGVTFVLREGDLVFYADEDAIAPLWKGQRFPINACISGWAILNRYPAVISDIYQDPRIPADLYRPTFVKSLMMVPMRSADPLGAIGAYWATQRMPTAREVELLQALADSAAVAVDNARLYASERHTRHEAEIAATARKELVAVVSHDLRNPLSAIATSASLLGPMLVALNGRARRHLDVILRSTWRMERLIHDLLDVAAIEAGALTMNLAPLEVGKVFEQLSELLPLGHEKGQEFDFRPPEEAAHIHCDAERIHQVFSNLVGNASKFTPAGGLITVAAQLTENAVEFAVTDSGPGIAPEFMPQLFQPFHRRSRPIGGGVGLGLSIAKGIVEAHGGTLRALSPPGSGATFAFTIPRAR